MAATARHDVPVEADGERTEDRVGVRLPEDTFYVSGVHVSGRHYSRQTGGVLPGAASCSEEDSEACASRSARRRITVRVHRDTEDKVRKLNQKVEWLGQLLQSRGQWSESTKIVMKHARRRLRRWLSHKHKVADAGICTTSPTRSCTTKLGLGPVGCERSQLAVGEGVRFLSESRMREICTSGSMSGRWRRSKACGT